MLRYLPLIILFFFLFKRVLRKNDSIKAISKQYNKSGITPIDSSKQRDIADEIYQFLGKTAKLEQGAHPKKINFSIVPAIGYSLTTGFCS